MESGKVKVGLSHSWHPGSGRAKSCSSLVRALPGRPVMNETDLCVQILKTLATDRKCFQFDSFQNHTQFWSERVPVRHPVERVRTCTAMVTAVNCAFLAYRVHATRVNFGQCSKFPSLSGINVFHIGSQPGTRADRFTSFDTGNHCSYLL